MVVIRMNAFAPVPSIDAAPVNTGAQPEAAMADAMERLAALERLSTAEMLHELRRAYPDSPLAVRVRALEALRRR
jgi:hypothetical protein